ncbi:MAG: hypothetical protein QXZ22_08705 [Sulfolobales archaeon]
MTEEEKLSSEKESEKVKCSVCGREFKIQGIGRHLKKHKEEELKLQQTIPQQQIFLQPQPLISQQVQPINQPLVSHQLPQQQQQQDFDINTLLSLLSSLFSEKKDPIREKLEQAFLNWLDTVFSLPTVFTRGYGKGLEDSMRTYIRDVIKDELKEIRDVIEKVMKHGSEKTAT